MKQGMTLTELAQRVEAVEKSKKDLLVPATRFSLGARTLAHERYPETEWVFQYLDGVATTPVDRLARQQLHEVCGIPQAFADRLVKKGADYVQPRRKKVA